MKKQLLNLPLVLAVICAACLGQSPAIADTPVIIDNPTGTGSATVDGNVYFSGASLIIYKINSSASSAVAASLIVATGDIDIEAGAAIEFSDLSQTPSAFAPGTILTLINYGGIWNGGFLSLNGTSLAQGNQFSTIGTVWSIDYAATSGGLNFQADQITGKFINVTAVPEPSAYGLLALGAIVWAGLARRHRNSARLKQ
jgi:hypothetical protein